MMTPHTGFGVSCLAFLLLSTLPACEKDVTNELTLAALPPQLVIEGGISRFRENPSAAHTIRLTTTRPFLSTDPTTSVANALVTVGVGDTSYAFVHEGNGAYVNDQLRAEVGEEYRLTIVWQGDTYRATEELPEVPPIDSLYSVFQEEQLITDEGYFLQLDTRDPAGVANYYHYRVFRNGAFITLPDPGNVRTLVLSDEFFDGVTRIGVNPNEEVPFDLGDTGRAQQIGLTAGHYAYLRQVYEQTGYQGVSFVGNPPPASIRSNLLNETRPAQRALGWFSCTDVVEAELVVEP